MMTTHTPTRTQFNGAALKQLFTQYKMLALVIAIAFIWAFFAWKTEGNFLSPRNFSNLLRQMSITGMLACGMVFVIISGEIDLSVGSLLGLLGGVAAVLDFTYKLPLPLTITIVLSLGVLIGMFNGFWTAYMRVPSFIIGLGGMLVFRGVLLGVTGSMTISPVSEDLVYFGQGYLSANWGIILGLMLFGLLAFLNWRQRVSHRKYDLPIAPRWKDALKLALSGLVIYGFVRMLNAYEGMPVPVFILLLLLGAFTYMANQTVFGRRIYAVGSNMEATRLSGVNVQGVKMAIFGIMGLMCALAGLITTARMAAGSPSAGNMGELDAIAACFIGGTSMRGGSGTVLGALVGALVMASLDNGMSMLDVDAYWQMIVKGFILVLAVWIDVVSRSNR